ncbi:MAG TPA: hypothetical protein VN873_07720 [Candidatus Angelobacter sp.]|nr:hypothetical protein [Candidatus Angelobacter sp.]
MFTAKDIREMMKTKPFRPFKIYLSDGSSYEITNHDMAMISKNYIEVGVHPDPDGIVDRIVSCAILHISRIDKLQPA